MARRCWRSAVGAAEDRFGGIDVLVNNGGRGWYGAIEGMAETDVRSMFELNFFAVLTVTRGSGWIINMSSVAGLRGITGFGYCSATKFAIEAATDQHSEEAAPTPGSPTNPSRSRSPNTDRCSNRYRPR